MNIFFLIASLISVLSFFGICVGITLAQKPHPNHERRLTPHLTWCVMTAVASFVWFFPYFWSTYETTPAALKLIKTLLADLQNVIRIFAADESYADVMEAVAGLGISDFVYHFYSMIGVVLYLLAPILTFGFILSLFKNIHAYAKYYFSFCKEVHVFSELNERSLALASSIVESADAQKKKHFWNFKRKPLVIFADILDKNEEEHLDLVADAKEIEALLFRQDISAIHLNRSRKNMSFYLISDDENEKIAHMEHIIKRYHAVPNTKLYIFSDEEESKCFIDSYPDKYKENMLLEVIRVNDIRSLIYHNLDINGIRLFEKATLTHAHGDPDTPEREIHAVIVGFGKYGSELTKALLWYSQLPGYRVKMTVFDENDKTKDRFQAMCPEIEMKDKPYTVKNDMRYEIRFENCTVGTESFYDKLAKINLESPITYVFVCLGKDNLNIAISMGIRNRLAKLRCNPDIETVIYHSAIKDRIGVKWPTEMKESEMLPAKTQKKQKDTAQTETKKKFKLWNWLKYKKSKDAYVVDESGDKKPYRDIYEIHIIGDLESFYSEGTVIASDLIKGGLAVHYRYNEVTAEDLEKREKKRRTFYMDDYGFFSSVSKALHAKLRGEIAKKLKSEDPDIKSHAQKLFPAFVPETATGAEKEKRNWNLFVLENTVDMDKAAKLGKAMSIYGEKLNQAYEQALQKKYPGEKRDATVYPYEISDEMCEILDKGIWTFTDKENHSEKGRLIFEYEGKTYTSREVFEIAKSAADIEHIRWNAYMRAEGYSFVTNFKKNYDQKKKMHGNLTPCEKLNFNDSVKDI